ncbi:hypothetical protein DL98DRAFT_509100 [Cadophora sp. DSE1049]|nr:hypothetical protein DL98DRAFT_509100 [Cadophora sp. DSE1049]
MLRRYMYLSHGNPAASRLRHPLVHDSSSTLGTKQCTLRITPNMVRERPSISE